MYNKIAIFISAASALISLIALYHSIRYSYNPKLIIEPLDNRDVGKIVNFYNPESSVKYFLRRYIFRRKYKYAYGVWHNEHPLYSEYVLLWTRIMNMSKYPITIHDIKYGEYEISPFRINTLEGYEFKKIDICFENADERKEITISYDDFIKTPITLEPFSCVETYLIFFMRTRRFSKLRKTDKIRVKFCTSSKTFVKNLKVYNGFRFYKKTKISFALKKSD